MAQTAGLESATSFREPLLQTRFARSRLTQKVVGLHLFWNVVSAIVKSFEKRAAFQ